MKTEERTRLLTDLGLPNSATSTDFTETWLRQFVKAAQHDPVKRDAWDRLMGLIKTSSPAEYGRIVGQIRILRDRTNMASH